MNKLSDSAWLMIASLAACVSLLISTPASAGQDTYIVLYKANSVPSNAATALSAAGGKLVWSYREIGVAIAQSSDANSPPRPEDRGRSGSRGDFRTGCESGRAAV